MYTPFLMVSAALYRVGVGLRLWAYRNGVMNVRSLPGFVLSVGNLTAGGTGKTPAVITLAQWAARNGYRTAILSRGFGGKHQSRVLEVSDGSRIFCNAGTAGDEPCLMASKVPGVPVLISKKRYWAGMYAHKKFGTEVFILDDGFQHLELKRDLNLVLMDGAVPFGNRHLLPWGPLREPVKALKRADAMVLTRFSGTTECKRTADVIRRRFPGIPLFVADHVTAEVVFPAYGERRSPGWLMCKRVVAFAGIANPEGFKNTLEKTGAQVVVFQRFSDHYPYTADDIETLIRMKEEVAASCILTTEKDWVRIGPMASGCEDLAYLSVEFSFLPGNEGVFEMIGERIGSP